MDAIKWAPNGTIIAYDVYQGCFLSWRSLGVEIFDQAFYQTGCVRVLGAAQTANVLWLSLGGDGFIGAGAMIRDHFLLESTDSYVVKFVSIIFGGCRDKSSRFVRSRSIMVPQ